MTASLRNSVVCAGLSHALAHSCARYFPVVQEAAPAGGSSLEKQGNSKKLHWQKSFDEHSVLNLSKSSFLKFRELSNERNAFS